MHDCAWFCFPRPVTGTSSSPGLSKHITRGRRSGNTRTWVPITLITRSFHRTWTWRVRTTPRSHGCTWLPGRWKRAPNWKSKHVLFYLEINSSFSVNHTREQWTSSRKVKTIWGAKLPAQGMWNELGFKGLLSSGVILQWFYLSEILSRSKPRLYDVSFGGLIWIKPGFWAH